MSEEKEIQKKLPVAGSQLPGTEGRAPETRQTETPNPQPQTSEPMDVHHHGHVHHQKKWKEYLFQFLMLFLAVFCGFFAEYQLEHKIEKDREKQFIGSLINDITADTARIRDIISLRTSRERRFDSLSFLLNSPSVINHTNELYLYALYATRRVSIRFVPSDGTLQQLKNSGGLRMIRNRKVVDSITSYDAGIRSLLRQAEGEERVLDSYMESAARIFNALVFDSMLDENNLIRRINGSPSLLPFTPNDLNDYNSNLFRVRAINRSSRREEGIVLKQAENLLALLKKEYDIE